MATTLQPFESIGNNHQDVLIWNAAFNQDENLKIGWFRGNLLTMSTVLNSSPHIIWLHKGPGLSTKNTYTTVLHGMEVKISTTMLSSSLPFAYSWMIMTYSRVSKRSWHVLLGCKRDLVRLTHDSLKHKRFLPYPNKCEQNSNNSQLVSTKHLKILSRSE